MKAQIDAGKIAPGAGFDHREIESKWNKKWASEGLYEPDFRKAKNPFYNLMMFPYPSAEGLHVGNMYAFCGSDIYGRLMRMKGKDVFEPIGLDGFGIHSENYALKVGEHPMKLSKKTEANFYRQLAMIGNGFAWGSKLETYRSNYYKWTQWIFTLMFKSGLAYRGKAKVNWCSGCLTVLSDEQVVSRQLGKQDTGILGEENPRNQIFVCERCGTEVEKRDLTQWFFRITDYAGRLLTDLEKIDWSEKVKTAQRNWIGKSEGAVIKFKVKENSGNREKRTDNYIEVFTTRPDTIFGATYLVLAPEHPLVTEIIKRSKGLLQKEIRTYVAVSVRKSEAERQNMAAAGAKRAKTGVKTTLLATNPFTKKQIPVFVADYVLTSYGTGAIMGVPAHDQRDWVFASKYHLDIVEVVEGGNISREAFTGSGKLINSGSFNGQHSQEAIRSTIKYIQEHHFGFEETRWHLRDWLISRQRYWGPPIPMIFCENCAKAGKSWFTERGREGVDWESAGWYPVEDKDLPVELPYIENFKPTGSGVSPLASEASFVNVKCPGCQSAAKRETDVSDTFLDSAWYFLRYPSCRVQSAKGKVQSERVAWDPEIIKKWLPVDMYIGGAEHSVLHLLYSRFVTKVFYDLGLVGSDEPFTTFRAHGLLIKDGAKMSKSKGNVINPDEYIEKYGADVLRTYLMFCGRFDTGGDFRDSGIAGMSRFLRRVWRLVMGQLGYWETRKLGSSIPETQKPSNLHLMHKTIKKVTSDIAGLDYNTAISAIMEWLNFLEEKVVGSRELVAGSRKLEVVKQSKCKELPTTLQGKPSGRANYKLITRPELETLVLLLAPFAPYLCEELWSKLGNKFSVHTSSWPLFSEELATAQDIVLVLQVNGRVRDTVKVVRGTGREEAEKLALSSQKVKKFLEGKKPGKVIFVADKLINFVT